MGISGAIIFTVCLSVLYAVIIRTAVVCLKKTGEQTGKDAVSPKITIVVSNIAMAAAEFFLIVIWVLCARGSFFHSGIYISDIVGSMILLTVIYCMPMINLLLYRRYYIKADMPRRWVTIPFTLLYGEVSFYTLMGLYGSAGGTVGYFGNVVCFLPIASIAAIFLIYIFKHSAAAFAVLAAIYLILILGSQVLSGARLMFEISIITAYAAAVAALSYIPYFKKDMSRLLAVIPVSVLIGGIITIFTFSEYYSCIILKWIEMEFNLNGFI